jgi:hypothetical protein
MRAEIQSYVKQWPDLKPRALTRAVAGNAGSDWSAAGLSCEGAAEPAAQRPVALHWLLLFVPIVAMPLATEPRLPDFLTFKH